MSLALVETYEQVRYNIITYNRALDDALAEDDQEFIGFMSTNTHWYYDPGTKLFGPCKFIGYLKMTRSQYCNKKGLHTNGGIARKRLESILHFTSANDDVGLRGNLAELFYPFKKKPNKAAKIWVIHRKVG